jgi:uncharacterized membrane protein
MNTNSFQIKTFCITLVAALLALFSAKPGFHLIILSILITLGFWLLDSFYLQQERKARGVYDDVAGITNANTVLPFEVPLAKYSGGKYSFRSAFFSPTTLMAYSSIGLVLIGIGVLVLAKII